MISIAKNVCAKTLVYSKLRYLNWFWWVRQHFFCRNQRCQTQIIHMKFKINQIDLTSHWYTHSFIAFAAFENKSLYIFALVLQQLFRSLWPQFISFHLRFTVNFQQTTKQRHLRFHPSADSNDTVQFWHPPSPSWRGVTLPTWSWTVILRKYACKQCKHTFLHLPDHMAEKSHINADHLHMWQMFQCCNAQFVFIWIEDVQRKCFLHYCSSHSMIFFMILPVVFSWKHGNIHNTGCI
jgi:hypothetical protein